MRVLEILNHPPGETFIQQHAIALNTHAPDIELCWAFTQTDKSGRMPALDFANTKCYAWPNYNLLPNYKQAIIKARYFGKSLDALNKPQLNFLRKLKPDLVHFHFSTLAVKYAHLCLQLNIPYTFSLRGSDLHTLTNNTPEQSTYIKQLAHVSNKAQSIHAVSEHLKKDFFHLTQSNTIPQVIRTTVNDSWANIERNPKPNLILAVGRLTWQKGFSDLILAINILRNQNSPIQLVIIGDGPQRQELEYMVRDLGLSENIYIVGKQSQDEIKNWLGKAHAFVLSSIAEGFPNVLAEAMLAGVPVVTSNCGGIPELIENEKHALVYEAGSIFELANQIKKALASPNQINMTHLSAHIAEDFFSQKSHTKKFKKLWT